MHPFVEQVLVAGYLVLRASFGGATAQEIAIARDRVRALYASATDEELEAYAQYISDTRKTKFEDELARGKKCREDFQKKPLGGPEP